MLISIAKTKSDDVELGLNQKSIEFIIKSCDKNINRMESMIMKLGRYSIKIVLRPLFQDDELDYKKLASIQNGGDAMDTFLSVEI